MLERFREALRACEARGRNLIDRNADGLIVVRQSGVVALVNPAAEALLGRRAADLVGTLFGIPLVPGEAEEVDILRGTQPGGVAEMRVAQIDWEGEPAYLATLRDVTERKRSAEALRFLAQASSVLADSLDLAAGLAGLRGARERRGKKEDRAGGGATPPPGREAWRVG